jgi:hypothetical protein
LIEVAETQKRLSSTEYTAAKSLTFTNLEVPQHILVVDHPLKEIQHILESRVIRLFSADPAVTRRLLELILSVEIFRSRKYGEVAVVLVSLHCRDTRLELNQIT